MLKRCFSGIASLLVSGFAQAHVPFIDGKDFNSDEDVQVRNILQSKAYYSYLDTADIDQFVMQIEEPTRIYLHMLIPFCKEYANFAVTYALTGPGISKPSVALPVALPDGYGAIVFDPAYENWSERPFMYEFFTDRQYFESIRYKYDATLAGEYRLIVWHKDKREGDYVAIIGRRENFSPGDMELSYQNTRIIRDHAEMRQSCTYEGNFSDWFKATN